MRMMAVLDLEPGFTLVELKARYKTLVKRHHPDRHGGDRDAEERLKAINEAYTYLVDNRLHR
jgi:curved DNA-binding protein CbpA